MKILFACHRLPFPPNRGGKIRPFHMIQHLSKKHSVTVASVAHTQEELTEGAGLKEHCAELLAEVVPNSQRWSQAVLALPSDACSSGAYFRSNKLRERVRHACRKNSFDLAVVHCAFAAQYLDIPELTNVPRVIDFGDLDSAKWLDYSQHRSFPFSLGYGIEARKLRRYEKRVAREFGNVTLTTQGERDEFLTYGIDVPSDVIPNGVNTSYFQARGMQPKTMVMAFLGRMDYYPNIDGVLYFVEEIYPLIRKKIPMATLRVIGSNPIRSIQELAKISGITVTGHVPDVRPYLEDAALGVVPLRIARGTQNKILELMAAAIPVVSTAAAAKGIQAVANRDLLVADDPATFARRVVEVLEQEPMRHQLAEAGRRQVAEAHRWAPSMEKFERFLMRAAGQTEAAAASVAIDAR
jgi:sugar transferase (PEP-CTERM/EpsH1 system associated)